MKRLRTILILAPLLLIAATCVTDVRQRGPAGPWVGEVTNYGPEATGYTYVDANVIDAQRRVIGRWQTQACPIVTLPGEASAFEIRIDEGTVDPSWNGFDPVMPLRLDDLRWSTFPVSEHDLEFGLRRDFLKSKIVKTDTTQDYAVAELTNTSPFDVQITNLCAIHRTATGQVASVATQSVTQSPIRRGESLKAPLFFSTLGSGPTDVFAEGYRMQGCCAYSLPSSAVEVSLMRIVQRDDGRYLYVTGTVHNERGEDLTGLELSAHLDDRWEERIDRAFIGCEGSAARASRTPFILEIPVASNETRRTLNVEAIAAGSSTVYEFPVTNVGFGAVESQSGGHPDLRTVTATLKNNTSFWIEAFGVCVALKNRDGVIIGAGYAAPEYPARFVAPGGTLRINTQVVQLEPATSAEVIGYGIPTDGPPPPPIQGPSNPGG